MISDDTYRAKLQQTIAAIKAWTGFVADVARVEEGEIPGAWRLALTPRSARACPIEIVLRDDQRCDLRVGGETYEDLALTSEDRSTSLDLMLPLLEAVVEGNVLTRRISSAGTGLLCSVASIVTLQDGTRFEHVHAPARLNGAAVPDAVEIRDIHYLPYRRPGSQTAGSQTERRR
jgi:hypothetical protein